MAAAFALAACTVALIHDMGDDDHPMGVAGTVYPIYVSELKEYVRRLGDRRSSNEQLVWFNVDWIESPIALPEASPPASHPLAVGPSARRITSGP